MHASTTVVQLQGKEIVVSLSDGIIEYARDVQHAKQTHSLWMEAQSNDYGTPVGTIEWQDFDAAPEHQE